jgi:hypothetical protein
MATILSNGFAAGGEGEGRSRSPAAVSLVIGKAAAGRAAVATTVQIAAAKQGEHDEAAFGSDKYPLTLEGRGKRREAARVRA